MLVELERISGKRIHELFDLMVGTSTGGILVIALACPSDGGQPSSAEQVRSLYIDHGEAIFPLGDFPPVSLSADGNWLIGTGGPVPADATTAERLHHFKGHGNVGKIAGVIRGSGSQGNARYSEAGLERQLSERFGDRKMSEALVPIGVVSCDFDRGEPIMFWGGGITADPIGDAKMRDAARATSAAPTFFPPLFYNDLESRVVRCVDGGLIANDPGIVGYTTAIGILADANRVGEDVLLVSLGTGLADSGDSLESHDLAQMGDTRSWAELAPFLMKAFTFGPGALARDRLSAALGESYVRIQTTLPADVSAAMDDASPAHVRQLLDVAVRAVETNHDLIESLATTLAEA